MFERNLITNSVHKIQAVYRNMKIIILDVNLQEQGECHVLYHLLGSPWHWVL